MIFVARVLSGGPARIGGLECGVVWLQHGEVPVAAARFASQSCFWLDYASHNTGGAAADRAVGIGLRTRSQPLQQLHGATGRTHLVRYDDEEFDEVIQVKLEVIFPFASAGRPTLLQN